MKKVSWIIIIVRRKIKRVQNLGDIWGQTSRAQEWQGKWAYEQKENVVGYWVTKSQ